MLKFNSIGQIEHNYAFEDAVIDTDMYNGAFGSVSDGKFTTAATATKAIMQLENGDDAGLDKYVIKAGSHVRIVDLEKFVGQKIEVYGYPLPAIVAVGNKLESEAAGTLKVNGSAAGLYLEVESIIGNNQGVVAKIVKNA